MSRSKQVLMQTEKNALTEIVAEKLKGWLPGQLIESGVPGAVAAVVEKGDIVWQSAFGNLDHSDSPPVDSETLFCVRSLAKGITAMAVLVAVQDGLVDLDVPVKEYLPDFTIHSRFEPIPEEHITLRHLLAHRAGFTHDEPPGNNLDHPEFFQVHIESISDTWLRFPVGYRYAYTNLGFDLAGYILQVRSGISFAHYVQQKVLDPIGMTSSSFDIEVIEGSANRAIGHSPRGKAEPPRFPEIPAAGLYSNLEDMARYIQFHLGDGTVNDIQILRPDLMKELHTIQFARPNQQTGYCYGIWRQLVSNTYSFSHSGGGRGFQSQVIVYPELRFGVLLLTNKDGHGLTESPFQKTVDDQVLARFGPNHIFEPDIEGMRIIPPDDPRTRSIFGRYWDGDNWIIGVKNGVIGLQVSPHTFHPLTFYEDGGEIVGIYEESKEIRFMPPYGDQQGSMMSIDRHLLNCNYRAFNDSPFDQPGPGTAAWQDFYGDYEVLWDNEPIADIRISPRNGCLYFGETKCIEYEHGLFFTCDGEALDFRSDPPTAANLILRRKEHLA